MNSKAIAAKITVETFASIVGKPLLLKDGKKGYIVKDVITAPLKSPDVYIIVERQVSHLLFGSNSAAREAFVSEFITRTIRKGVDPKNLGLPIAYALGAAIDILNSHRIESLWQLIYPGSYADMRKALARAVPLEVPNPHSGLIALLIHTEAECSIPEGDLDPYIRSIQEALRGVEKRSYESCLLAARRMFSKWLDILMLEELIPNRWEAFARLASLLGTPAFSTNFKDYALGEFRPETADKLMSVDLKNDAKVEEILRATSSKMDQVLEKVKEKLTSETTSAPSDGSVTRTIVKSNDKTIKPSSLTEEDRVTASKLRKIFADVLHSKGRAITDSGTEVDVYSVIERKASNYPVPCFWASKANRGFKLTLLIDRSASMKGSTKNSKARQAERGAFMLLKALDLPGVVVEAWGFQSYDHGKVELTKFNPKLESFESDSATTCFGYTPLHIAIREGVEGLSEGVETKHLVVLTDGGPYFVDRTNKAVASKTLRDEVRRSVQLAHKRSVHVTALLIGKDESSANLEYMFGSQANWAYLDEEDFARDMVRAVQRSFEKFLRKS